MGYEQILVRITGKDRIGLTAAFMEILAKYDAQILDIGQADIHSTLSLGILIRMDEQNSGQVMKELLFKTTELGVQIGFEPVPDDEYEEWASRQGRTRYILTVIGRSLSAAQIEAAAKIVAGGQDRGRAGAGHRFHQAPHGPSEHCPPRTEHPRLH